MFHIIRFEDLARDERAVARALYGFLGVATDFMPEVARVANPGGLPKNQLLHRILADPRVVDFGKRYLPERLLDRAKAVRNDNLEKQRMTPEEREAALAVLRDDILRTGDLVGQDLRPGSASPRPRGRRPPRPESARRRARPRLIAGPGFGMSGRGNCRAEGVRPTER